MSHFRNQVLLAVVLLVFAGGGDAVKEKVTMMVPSRAVYKGYGDMNMVGLKVCGNTTVAALRMRIEFVRMTDVIFVSASDGKRVRKHFNGDTVYSHTVDLAGGTYPEEDGCSLVYGFVYIKGDSDGDPFGGWGMITATLEMTSDAEVKFVIMGESAGLDLEKHELHRVRRAKRAINQPIWVNMREVKGENIIWLKPLQSVYGVQALALAGGSDYWVGHDYVELPNYEQFRYSLIHPCLGVAGPVHVDDVPSFGTLTFSRVTTIFRYSSRDSAWLLWNYSTGKPTWAGDIAISDWQKISPSCSSDIPGQIFDGQEQ